MFVKCLSTWLIMVIIGLCVTAGTGFGFDAFDILANYNTAITGDANGEGVSLTGASKTVFQLGESNVDTGNNRMWYSFLPTAEERIRIAEAKTVTLSLTFSARHNATGFAVDVYAMTNETATPPPVNRYEKDGLLIAASAFTAQSTAGVPVVLDVTAVAQAEAARSGTSLIAFRAQMNPGGPTDLPLVNTLWDAYVLCLRLHETQYPRLRITPFPIPPCVIVIR